MQRRGWLALTQPATPSSPGRLAWTQQKDEHGIDVAGDGGAIGDGSSGTAEWAVPRDGRTTGVGGGGTAEADRRPRDEQAQSLETSGA
jgi:hypothetical protein